MGETPRRFYGLTSSPMEDVGVQCARGVWAEAAWRRRSKSKWPSLLVWLHSVAAIDLLTAVYC